MFEKDCSACLDKKVTDYQISVDRQLIEQDQKIKTHQDYLINAMDSHKKLIEQQNKALNEFINNPPETQTTVKKFSKTTKNVLVYNFDNIDLSTCTEFIITGHANTSQSVSIGINKTWDEHDSDTGKAPYDFTVEGSFIIRIIIDRMINLYVTDSTGTIKDLTYKSQAFMIQEISNLLEMNITFSNKQYFTVWYR